MTIILCVGLVTVPNASFASDYGDVEVGWGNNDVESGAWGLIPGSDGLLEQTPSVGPEDKYLYEARLACADGDSVIFTACAQVMPSCSTGTGSDQGKPGVAIYWYRASKASPSVWTYLSGPECVYGEKPRDILAEIAAAIAREFQRTPVAPATIGSQPGPHTLRGEETNVYADAATQSFDLTMLGQQVTITATPVAYTWNYGDGTIWGPTPHHGAPLHEDRIGEQTQTSHIYTATGRLGITVTTHFDGTYSVNGGPQLPIPGQGNIPSAPLGLTVWRAETRLYADDCLQNPSGVGC
ncbi:hypothetical protein [Arthrobacter sp. HLT1-20]